jgi:lysozyme
MNQRHQASRAAIGLIKRFEGYRRSAARLDDGRWTIGYGHTKTAREGVSVSEADAEALLIYDLMEVSAAINERVYSPLTQNQFDALCAFVFNVGLDNFAHSGVLRRLNEGAMLQAACGMEMWRKADFEGERILVDALVRRRAAEKALFLTPPGGFIPAPSPILRPKVDHAHAGSVPAEAAVELATPLDGARAVAERVSPAPATPAASEPAAERFPLAAEAEEPSRSEVAAAAITARLQEILKDEEEAASPEAEVEAEATPEAPSEPGADLDLPSPPAPGPDVSQSLVLTPPSPEAPAEPVLWPRSESETTGSTEPELFNAEVGSFDDFAADAPSEALEDVEVVSGRPLGVLPFIGGLGIVGLVLFAAGIFWGFNAKESGQSLFSNPVLIGWGMGLAGIGCVATSVYLFLERLGGKEEQE